MNPFCGQNLRLRATTIRLGLSLAVLAGLGVSQKTQEAEGTRGRAFGKVIQIDGKPWAGADVRLESFSGTRFERLFPKDVVVARTDARGRFQAQLLPGRPYLAVATAAFENNTYRVGRPPNFVMVGTPIVIRQDAEVFLHIRLRIEGREHWKHLGPVRFEVTGRELKLDRDGVASLPRIFNPYCNIMAWDQQGRQVAQYGFYVGQTWRRKEQSEATTIQIWKLPKHTRTTLPVLVQVKDAKTKTGLAGATLCRYDERAHRHHRLGTTDADGFSVIPATLTLGRDAKPRVAPEVLYARHSKYAEMSSRMGPPPSPSRTLTPEELRKREEPDAVFELAIGSPLRGRVLGLDGKPAAGLALLYQVRMGRLTARARVFETDKDGRFELPGRAKGHAFRILVPLTSKSRAHFAPRQGSLLHALAILAARKAEDEQAEDLGDLRIADLVPLDLHLLHGGGTGVTNQAIAVKEEPWGRAGPKALHPAMTLFCSARGMARLVVPRGLELIVAATSAGAYTTAQVKIPADARDAVSAQLSLPEQVVVRGRVSSKGKVVRGAHAMFDSSQQHARQPNYLGQMVAPTQVAVDNDGTFQVSLCPGVYRVIGFAPGGFRSDPTTTIEIGETPPEPITVELNKE